MIDNPGEEKKDDGNYYAEHIYASPSEPSSPLGGSREFTSAYYPFALIPRYDYFVISLFLSPQKFTTTVLLRRSRLRDSTINRERALRPIVELKSPPHPIENEH